MSLLFKGSISDKRLVEQSGLLEKLEGDELMADKDFKIDDILALCGVCLTIAPFLGGQKQMSAGEVVKTPEIACGKSCRQD